VHPSLDPCRSHKAKIGKFCDLIYDPVNGATRDSLRALSNANIVPLRFRERR
jgi:hypothetical protein